MADRRTVGKWVQRFREGGEPAPEDRSSRPARPPLETSASTVALIRELREAHGLPAWPSAGRSTCPVDGGAWLRRLGLHRRPAGPTVPVQRYKWPAAGDLVHMDIKRVGRFRRAGSPRAWRPATLLARCGLGNVHVAVDDCTRLASVEVLSDQCGPTCAALLARGITWYRARGIVCQRVLADNGRG